VPTQPAVGPWGNGGKEITSLTGKMGRDGGTVERWGQGRWQTESAPIQSRRCAGGADGGARGGGSGGQQGKCIVEASRGNGRGRARLCSLQRNGQTSFDYVVNIRTVGSEKRARLINIEREVIKSTWPSVDADGAACTRVHALPWPLPCTLPAAMCPPALGLPLPQVPSLPLPCPALPCPAPRRTCTAQHCTLHCTCFALLCFALFCFDLI
jgi:hypothetical protein